MEDLWLGFGLVVIGCVVLGYVFREAQFIVGLLGLIGYGMVLVGMVLLGEDEKCVLIE